VASTGDACHGDDDGVQWRWDGLGSRGDGMARGRRKGTGMQGAKPCWWASNGEETGRTVADDERIDGRSRAREEGLMSGVGPLERERVRGKGLERLTCGAD
jgi:hypothetical protein